MPPFGAIKRRELIRYLRQLGWVGPYSGKRHQYMLKDSFKLTIPNPHQGDISVDLLGDVPTPTQAYGVGFQLILEFPWEYLQSFLLPAFYSEQNDQAHSQSFKKRPSPLSLS